MKLAMSSASLLPDSPSASLIALANESFEFSSSFNMATWSSCDGMEAGRVEDIRADSQMRVNANYDDFVVSGASKCE